MSNVSMVEVKPLRPVVGSYRCTLAEADYVDDDLREADGLVIKSKTPRKRFIGRIAERRALSTHEIEAALRGDLAANIELEQPDILASIKPGATSMPAIYATVHPVPATLMLPVELADSLVSRGIAERVARASK